MSYYIEYDPHLKARYPSKSRIRKKVPLVLTISIFVVAAVYVFAGAGFIDYLIPGDKQTTAAAFFSMVDLVREGEPVGKAVFCFFKDVITDGLH